MSDHSDNDIPRDRIFATPGQNTDFVFDERVAAVFTDMINRSVPGYATIVSMSGMLAERYCQPGSRVYDLGCSLGGTTLAMAHHIGQRDYRLVAVDNSPAMIQRFSRALENEEAELATRIELKCADIDDLTIDNASVVALNFTLQFIDPARRDALIRRIAGGMRPGGILILSEKIAFPDRGINDLFIDLYHRFKKVQGYSDLEISQKRQALENVLRPESLEIHRRRCAQAGFTACDVWFQCFNFASLVAFMPGEDAT
ncbi:MAG: carboxy-S-adenosyl-L-methionine synthase CmoA [Pseudohongiellaceae bacterium]